MGAITDFLDIIHRPVSFIWNKISENCLWLRPQVKELLNWAQSIELLPISEV
jgi:hypothetical protein